MTPQERILDIISKRMWKNGWLTELSQCRDKIEIKYVDPKYLNKYMNVVKIKVILDPNKDDEIILETSRPNVTPAVVPRNDATSFIIDKGQGLEYIQNNFSDIQREVLDLSKPKSKWKPF